MGLTHTQSRAPSLSLHPTKDPEKDERGAAPLGARLQPRDVAAEDARLDPVRGHERAVPPADLLGEVDGAPEQPAGDALALYGRLVHLQLRDAAVVAHVGEDAEVQELEGLGVLEGRALIDFLPRHVALGVRPHLRVHELVVDREELVRGADVRPDDGGHRLGDVVVPGEQAREEGGLLRGHLRRRRQRLCVHDGAVAEGEDVRRAPHAQPPVREQAAAAAARHRVLVLRRLLLGDAVDGVQCERQRPDAGGPDGDAVGDGAPVGEQDLPLLHLVDAHADDDLAGHAVVPVALERRLGGVGHVLVEGAEDAARRLHEHDAHVLEQLRVVARRVLREEVAQLRGELDARGPRADDHEGERLAPLLVRERRDVRALEDIADGAAQARGVLDLLQERAVLLHALDAEGVRRRADAHHELVVAQLEVLDVAGHALADHALRRHDLALRIDLRHRRL
mmetsp:Transcript_4661/g.13281  ORF Transcript_4661/g.13281 Transcript_4661/m.13281 type:complete len:452 (-) Transcript_4661:713-2068(-)